MPPDRARGNTRIPQPSSWTTRCARRSTTLVDLAPLHQPKSRNRCDELRTRLPEVPHVACFDTAFHATLSAAASTYAVPAEWRERWGVRKFGFHGLSHAYASARAAELLGAAPAGGS